MDRVELSSKAFRGKMEEYLEQSVDKELIIDNEGQKYLIVPVINGGITIGYDLMLRRKGVKESDYGRRAREDQALINMWRNDVGLIEGKDFIGFKKWKTKELVKK